MASSDHLLPPTNPFSPARSSLKPSVISLPSTRGTLSNHPSPRSLLPSLSSRTLSTRQFSVEKTDLSVYPDWLSRRKDFQDMKSKYERLDTIDCFQVCLKPILMRTDLDVKALTKTVKRNPFFSSMKEAQLVEVVERLHSIHFPAKAVLMAKSDPADCLFLILSGKVGVYIETGKCVDEIIAGNVVGESAIQTRSSRSATIIAHEDVQALKLTYEDYDRVLYRLKLQDYIAVAAFLQSLPFFSDWNHSKLYRLASVMMVKQYQKAQVIFKRGETPHDLYMVREGCISLTIDLSLLKSNRWPISPRQWRQSDTTKTFDITLKQCKAGEFFGGEELIERIPLRSTAVCNSDLVLLFILREEFFNEIFSDRDRKALHLQTYRRPETSQLHYLLDNARTRIRANTDAMLDALDTNPVPVGRDMDATPDLRKREKWARSLNQARKREEKRKTVKLVCKMD